MDFSKKLYASDLDKINGGVAGSGRYYVYCPNCGGTIKVKGQDSTNEEKAAQLVASAHNSITEHNAIVKNHVIEA